MLYPSRFPHTCWTYFNRSVRTPHQVIQQALKPIGSGRDGFEMVPWRFYDAVRLGETLPSGYNDVVGQISKNLTGNTDLALYLSASHCKSAPRRNWLICGQNSMQCAVASNLFAFSRLLDVCKQCFWYQNDKTDYAHKSTTNLKTSIIWK